MIQLIRGLKWVWRNRKHVYFRKDGTAIHAGSVDGVHPRGSITCGIEARSGNPFIAFGDLDEEGRAGNIGDAVSPTQRAIFTVLFTNLAGMAALIKTARGAMELMIDKKLKEDT